MLVVVNCYADRTFKKIEVYGFSKIAKGIGILQTICFGYKGGAYVTINDYTRLI